MPPAINHGKISFDIAFNIAEIRFRSYTVYCSGEVAHASLSTMKTLVIVIYSLEIFTLPCVHSKENLSTKPVNGLEIF